MDWLNFSNSIDKKVSGVYLIKNTVNDKVYVGISSDLKYRIKKHYHQLTSNSHHNIHLQNSVNSYGIDNFSVEVIEFIEEEERLLLRENHFQQLYKSTDPSFGYNNLLTDINGSIRHSKESKRKISQGNKGKTKSLETRLKLSINLLGNKSTPHTEEYKRHMSDLMKGRILSIETREKLSKARLGQVSPLKGRKLGALSPKAVKLRCMNGKEYSTISEAISDLGCCRTTIKKLIKSGYLVRI